MSGSFNPARPAGCPARVSLKNVRQQQTIINNLKSNKCRSNVAINNSETKVATVKQLVRPIKLLIDC